MLQKLTTRELVASRMYNCDNGYDKTRQNQKNFLSGVIRTYGTEGRFARRHLLVRCGIRRGVVISLTCPPYSQM